MYETQAKPLGLRVTIEEYLAPVHSVDVSISADPLEDLAATTQQLAPGVEPGDLSTDELLDAIQASARWVAWGQARQMSLITELAMRRAGSAVGELTGARAVDSTAALSIGVRAVGEELACELTLSRRSADDRTATAVGLCLDAPETLDALAAGQIDLPRAEAILDLVQTLIGAETDAQNNHDGDGDGEEELARKLQEELLARAPGQRLADLKRTGRRAMISIDPAAATRRHTRKRRTRHVALIPDDDSMCHLTAYLPADQGIRANTAITTLARAATTPADRRTLDQLRADTLVEALTEAVENLHATSGPHGFVTAENTTSPDKAGPSGLNPDDADPPGLSHVDAGPLGADSDDVGSARVGAEGVDSDDARRAGQQTGEGDMDCGPRPSNAPLLPGPPLTPPRTTTPQTPAAKTPATRRPDAQITVTISAATLTGDDNEPGELHGYGPIIADMARDVAATGTWRCAILDTTHATLLGLGTSTYTPAYRPSQALRRHLSVRDRVCRAPGCNAPATRCDVDHLTPYPDGPTCECNTDSLCGFHHRIKHETGFRVRWSTNPDHPPGTLIWTSPSGREYIDYPACLDPNMVNRTLPSADPSITNTTGQTTRPGPGPGPGPGLKRARFSGPQPRSGPRPGQPGPGPGGQPSSNQRPNPTPPPKRDYGPPPF
jgi:hypothetical protein